MLLAGLGMDLKALNKYLSAVLRLTIIPTIFEVAVIAVIAFFTLAMPWKWGLLLG